MGEWHEECVDDVRVGQAEPAFALLTELKVRVAESSWMRWVAELRLATASAERWAVRGDFARADEEAARLSAMAAAVRRHAPALAVLGDAEDLPHRGEAVSPPRGC